MDVNSRVHCFADPPLHLTATTFSTSPPPHSPPHRHHILAPRLIVHHSSPRESLPSSPRNWDFQVNLTDGGGGSISLAVAAAGTFRVTLAQTKGARQLENPMVASQNPKELPKVSKVVDGAYVGIKAAFGAVLVNAATGEFQLRDAAGTTLTSGTVTPSGSISTGDAGAGGEEDPQPCSVAEPVTPFDALPHPL